MTSTPEFQHPRDQDWIIVPKWDRFQHYRDRDPIWIKVYTRLLSDPNFLGLSFAARGLLMTIWLAFCEANGQLSVRNCDRICDKRLSNAQLKALNEAGFLEISASKPLALARVKGETETETDSPNKVLKEGERKNRLLDEAYDVALDWKGGPSGDFGDRLDDLERKHKSSFSVSQREQLWDVAWKRELGAFEDRVTRPL
jgi:hypothetical protein